MSVVEPGSAGSSLLGRVKGILLRPEATWDLIDPEPATIGGLYRSYVVPLAAIPAVCTLVGMLRFGIGGIFGLSFRLSPVWLIVQAITSYALSLAMVYVLALIVEALAPTFGGTKDRVQAFKVCCYAMTASWVFGVFGLAPTLGVVGLLGALYSLYLLYLGLPKLMRVPQERATPYFAVVLVVGLVAGIVISSIAGRIASIGGPLHLSDVTGSTSLSVPGVSLELSELQKASKRADVAA
jgi:hypothetical protein